MADTKPTPLPSLEQHIEPLSQSTNTLLTTILSDPPQQEELTKINAIANQTQRQLNLLSDRIDQTTDTLDEFEITTLPLLVDRCQDLERMYRNIDQLYALIKEIEYSFDQLESRCDAIEAVQGSSASVRKNVGMFFRSMLNVDLKQTKPNYPSQDDPIIKSVPDFSLYIQKSYLSDIELEKIQQHLRKQKEQEQQEQEQQQQQQQQQQEQQPEQLKDNTNTQSIPESTITTPQQNDDQIEIIQQDDNNDCDEVEEDIEEIEYIDGEEPED